ncbi:MAG TPA: LamG domain-containing protein, partial [Verrucomicrobiae bacterium]|nr:LamG domain-containing protein [Verrucomicrobiae bacterium]
GDMEPSTVASPGGVFVPPGVFSSTNDYNNDPTYHSYWNDPIGANGIGVSGGGVSSIAVVGTEVWVAGGFLLPAFGIARFPTVESRLSNNNLPIDNLLNTYGPPYNVAYPGWGNSIAVVKGDGVPIPYVQGSFNSIGGPGSPGVSLVSGTNGIWANAIAYWFDVYETGPTNQTIWEPLSTNGLTSAGSPAYQCYIAATPNAIYAGGVFDAAGGNSVPFSGGNVAAARWLVATNFAIPEDQTNFTFYSGTNYSISSNIQFSGTTTIEPGATITCSNNTMEINGDLICPSIASATLNGGTLNISNNSSLSSLSNLSFAGTTLDFQLGSNSPGTITVSDCRFVDGGITWGGVASTYTLVLNNCLAVNPPDQAGETGGSTNTFLSDNTGHGSFELVNCTLDNWYYPVHNNNYPGSGGGDNFSAINCIFSEIALAYGGGDSPSQTSYSGSNNGFYEYAYDNGSQTPFGSNQTTNDWPFYQSPTIDDSSYYLATNSACHNVGTAGIDPALLAELRQRTTYSPGDGGFPDNYGNPDLGYHYESANPGTPCFPTPPGVVAGWSAESNAVDSINGNDGTFTGTESYAPGEVGLAFHFNGSSDVEVPDSSTLHFTNGMTVEAWVNLSNYTGHATEILSKLAAASLFANSYTFSIEGADTASTRRAYFTVVGTNYVAHQLFSSTNIPTNQWMHIAGTYDGATISIYVNGALSASAPFTNEIWPGTEPLSIGCSINGSPVSLFDGQIDEVNLYNRALTADEVQGIYYAGNAGKCLTLQP